MMNNYPITLTVVAIAVIYLLARWGIRYYFNEREKHLGRVIKMFGKEKEH